MSIGSDVWSLINEFVSWIEIRYIIFKKDIMTDIEFHRQMSAIYSSYYRFYHPENISLSDLFSPVHTCGRTPLVTIMKCLWTPTYPPVAFSLKKFERIKSEIACKEIVLQTTDFLGPWYFLSCLDCKWDNLTDIQQVLLPVRSVSSFQRIFTKLWKMNNCILTIEKYLEGKTRQILSVFGENGFDDFSFLEAQVTVWLAGNIRIIISEVPSHSEGCYIIFPLCALSFSLHSILLKNVNKDYSREL